MLLLFLHVYAYGLHKIIPSRAFPDPMYEKLKPIIWDSKKSMQK